MRAANHKTDWQEALSDLITDPEELLTMLELDPALLASARAAARLFPLKIPRGFIRRIKKGDPNDPLLKQVLPLGAELLTADGFSRDPLNEVEANPVPGLLHKYHGRVLVTLTSACAVHCRYCFRRSFPYDENNPGTRGWEKIFSYIADDDSINEVILSGGDPLAVNDKVLSLFTNKLRLIPHVKTLRIHTRLPVVLPERITDTFIEWISQSRFQYVMVIHANHPLEINDDVELALNKLRAANVQLLNQSVLLKGVNDDALVLSELSKRLLQVGVLPYYLHMLDKIQGAAHFDIPHEQAVAIHAALTRLLPGYLVPRLVRENAGAPSKTLVLFE